MQPQNRSKEVVVTFYEIYCGKLYDLLNSRNVLPIREDKKGNINVIGLNEKFICGAEEFMDLVEQGSLLRVTSQNATNEESSRSHAILQISIKDRKTVFSKISFIDLAGNERGADHMNMNKQTKIDGAEISKSLLSLKECIRALDQGKSHTPFRGSKLTMVLKDSFVGYCNTVMICNISPNTSSSENTMNTLRYVLSHLGMPTGSRNSRTTTGSTSRRRNNWPENSCFPEPTSSLSKSTSKEERTTRKSCSRWTCNAPCRILITTSPGHLSKRWTLSNPNRACSPPLPTTEGRLRTEVE